MQKSNDFQLILSAVDAIASRSDGALRRITDRDLRRKEYEALQKHSDSYSDFLETYVKEYKKKVHNQRVMKNWFFVLINILLFAIIGGGVAAVAFVCLKKSITTNDVAAVITAVVGAVSSFLILPRVIAENLFPSREEDKTAEIFEKMFGYDTNIRNFYRNLDGGYSDPSKGNQDEK